MLKGDILAVARMPEKRQAGEDRRLRAQPCKGPEVGASWSNPGAQEVVL